MKTLVIGILACCAGYLAGLTSDLTDYDAVENWDDDYKAFVIALQHEALLKADTLIDRNNLIDYDGSDTMEDWLILRNDINGLYE